MTNKIWQLIFCTTVSMVASSCTALTETSPSKGFKPSRTFNLPEELNEISGLSYISDSVIACVQDEKGKVYYLNSHTGKIIAKSKFAKEGDFEGIAFDGQSVFVLRSDGKIYEHKEGKELKKYVFEKHKHFDFEGLCYDQSKKRLLVACKSHEKKKENDYIHVYEFDLKKMKYKNDPVFKIKKEAIHENFKPSGIAIHPNGSIYILSSFSKTLLRINAEGEVLDHNQLNSFVFRQPEGICFDKNGGMYISNEINEGNPTLLYFVRTKK